jgi:DUF917 family protein
MREIHETQMSDIARGAAVLGTGGGGDPYVGRLLAEQAMRKHGPVTLLDVEELPDDAVVVPVALMGAPTVMPAGDEATNALRAVEQLIGKRITHTVSIEAGGLNSVTPFVAAAEMGLPLVDADAMGRAFPELQMVLPTLSGVQASPMTMADERGNAVTMQTVDNAWAERLARAITVEMGCTAAVSLYVLTGRQIKDLMVPGTITLCEQLGQGIREAREQHQDPVAAATALLHGQKLFTGKIVDIQRKTVAGFARGEAHLDGVGEDTGSHFELAFQNEHLVARLDTDSGEPVTTEMLRYGVRVTVLAAPCDPRWRTDAALELVGPGYFGYDHKYVPIG